MSQQLTLPLVSPEKKVQSFKKVTVESVKKGENRLVAGGIIVFNDGKEAKLTALTGYTFTVAGCLKYYHPKFQKDCYIKVENDRLVNHINRDIENIDHFMLPIKK